MVDFETEDIFPFDVVEPQEPLSLPETADVLPFEIQERENLPLEKHPLAPTNAVPQDTLQYLDDIEHRANQRGIFNILDDGGLKTFFLLDLLDLQSIPGKGGNDAQDALGRRFEVKTINLKTMSGEVKKGTPSITTGHSLSAANITRYQETDGWIIALYFGHHLREVWQIDTKLLEPFFQQWREKLPAPTLSNPHPTINNPHIGFNYVVRHGQRVWPPDGVE